MSSLIIELSLFLCWAKIILDLFLIRDILSNTSYNSFFLIVNDPICSSVFKKQDLLNENNIKHSGGQGTVVSW